MAKDHSTEMTDVVAMHITEQIACAVPSIDDALSVLRSVTVGLFKHIRDTAGRETALAVADALFDDIKSIVSPTN